jgi:methionyl-tRNA synthetase
VAPRLRANEVARWLEEGLQDLSVSRTRERLKWGIEVPDDPEHTVCLL